MDNRVKAQYLKPFKKELKRLIKANCIQDFLLQTCKSSIYYEAKAVTDLLFVMVPGSKLIDGEVKRISQLSLRRKRKTIRRFVEKRIHILSRQNELCPEWPVIKPP